MKILSIETSCDETAVSLLDISGSLEKPDINVLGNSLMSQVALHEQYGGVYPNLAKREHQKNLPPLLEKTLREAGESLESPDIDCIAVTTGPGLEPALWVGIIFAQELGKKWHKPVVPINHMEGHIFSVLYKTETNSKSQILNPKSTLKLPALALLVSGGHTELVYIRDFGHYEILGRTLDDAVGEAFDKVARMLGLTYPGGPKISRLAEIHRQSGKISAITFPRPMLHSGNLNFSFSGLKTAVLYKLKAENRTDDEFKAEVARAFEDAAIGALVEKTRQALVQQSDIKTLIVAGGVSANAHLASEMQKLITRNFPAIHLSFPGRELSTDNAVMIGIAAYINIRKNPKILERRGELKASGNLSISSR